MPTQTIKEKKPRLTVSITTQQRGRIYQSQNLHKKYTTIGPKTQHKKPAKNTQFHSTQTIQRKPSATNHQFRTIHTRQRSYCLHTHNQATQLYSHVNPSHHHATSEPDTTTTKPTQNLKWRNQRDKSVVLQKNEANPGPESKATR